MAAPAPDLIPPVASAPGRGGASPAFNLNSSDSSDLDDDAPLPFPEALPRSDFLGPDFQPAPYLSALPHRHQTLEDLRSDLRDRSAAISSELLELVNSNYTAFLSLGNELRGGDDKIEDVKVSLLGFRRAVEEVKTRVSTRKEETQTLSEELRGVRSAIEQGQCSRIVALSDTIGHDTPWGVKTEERLNRCRNTLLLDLSNALKEAKKAGARGQDRAIKYLAVYRVLGAEADAIKALRGG
ncbi:hypothetical protein AUP68_14483 [Ilyonectria robusta]